MAKDFAKKKPVSRQAKPKQAVAETSHISFWMWLFTSLTVIAFVCLLIYLGQRNATAPTKVQPPTQVTVKEGKPKPKPVKPAKPAEPQWTFPEELKEREVEVEVDPVASRPLKEYIMQCGSFRKRDQAEQLEARIAFTGLQAEVRETEGKNGLWYRVVLGPYQGKRSADRDRHLLQDNKIEGCRIW
jgi:cell division protein FtsN